MPDQTRRRIRRTVRSVAVFTGTAAALALMTAGSATAEPPKQSGATETKFTLAAADGAGWLLFRGHRSERAEQLAPTSVPLAGVAEPETPPASPADSLSRWGTVRAIMSTR